MLKPHFIMKATMSLNNTVVWLDHTKAQVIHFDKNASSQ
jgi:hypothetical protein